MSQQDSSEEGERCIKCKESLPSPESRSIFENHSSIHDKCQSDDYVFDYSDLDKNEPMSYDEHQEFFKDRCWMCKQFLNEVELENEQNYHDNCMVGTCDFCKKPWMYGVMGSGICYGKYCSEMLGSCTKLHGR